VSGWSQERLQAAHEGRLQGLIGLELLRVAHGELDARMQLKPDFMAPNGYVHAGTVVSMADSCCGEGCLASLPEGMAGFTTSELKTNFLRSAAHGDALLCEARMVHEGRTTQVWDATVRRESDGKPVALFRCTEYLLADADPRTQPG
jgi:1,4-dihydroxy-2-naphthoyl-CoA hydrolase